MKLLLAIITCHNRKAYADTQRETWIPKIPEGLDYKFFLGPSERTPESDEVFLDCDDSYMGLPSKVQAVVRWALKNGYDRVAKIDDDVILKPSKFLKESCQSSDFSGKLNSPLRGINVPWGFLYTLSKKSMEIVADAKLPENNNDEAWCAETLYKHGILLHNERRYHLHRGRRSDFVKPEKRTLRAVPRPEVWQDLEHAEEALAYVMFIHWDGYNTSDERNITAMKKVFLEMSR